MKKLAPEYVASIVELALAEDIGSGDITASLIPPEQNAKAKIIARQNAVICGIDFAALVFQKLDPNVQINWLCADGDAVSADQIICELFGNARALLSGERTALNFLQMLSATATQTYAYVTEIHNSKTKLLDTRKTLPGLRCAQKYAVVCGGGKNHRFGLYDAILLKENHIAAYGSITAVVATARDKFPGKSIEVEVTNLLQLKEALASQVDIIMLDNFSLDMIKRAVIVNAARAKLEVSGGVNLDTIRELAATGVDYISVGALTKNVAAVDLSMLFEM